MTDKNSKRELAEMAEQMTDEELREALERIRGNPKQAGSRAKSFRLGEALALAALSDEVAKRVSGG